MPVAAASSSRSAQAGSRVLPPPPPPVPRPSGPRPPSVPPPRDVVVVDDEEEEDVEVEVEVEVERDEAVEALEEAAGYQQRDCVMCLVFIGLAYITCCSLTVLINSVDDLKFMLSNCPVFVWHCNFVCCLQWLLFCRLDLTWPLREEILNDHVVDQRTQVLFFGLGSFGFRGRCRQVRILTLNCTEEVS